MSASCDTATWLCNGGSVCVCFSHSHSVHLGYSIAWWNCRLVFLFIFSVFGKTRRLSICSVGNFCVCISFRIFFQKRCDSFYLYFGRIASMSICLTADIKYVFSLRLSICLCRLWSNKQISFCYQFSTQRNRIQLTNSFFFLVFQFCWFTKKNDKFTQTYKLQSKNNISMFSIV